jgi:ABC-type transport system involved in multi-copper enzyme maturation permease subunit
MKSLSRIISISRFTVADEIHHKSFFVLLAACVILVMSVRGCYRSEYSVNGQKLDGISVAWHTSIIAYHVIATFCLFAAMVLSNRTIRRDKQNGTMCFALARPVSRLEYTAGKVLGTWLLAFAFMFVLHASVFFMTLSVSGGTLPMLPVASLLCGLNLLLCVCLFMLLSMFLPEVISLAAGIGVMSIGYASDILHVVMHSAMMQQALSMTAMKSAVWWRIAFAWPKIAALQIYGDSLIKKESFAQMGPLHPAINVIFWTVLLFVLLVWRINREEI